ncbi:MAG: hypothetical protein KUG79_10995 [Pseudomonadales bacterium]|nr:hypothetical protein [Pseudomonadales bacterium]
MADLNKSIVDGYVQTSFRARQDKKPKPLASQTSPDLDGPDAYKIQAQLVSLIVEQDPIAGYKAALSNAMAQKMFKVDSAASGVLFASGLYESGAEIAKSNFVMPVLETEIGFQVGTTLNPSDGPVDLQTAKRAMAAVLPMVEVADTGFVARVSLATDLIAANSGSASFVVGEHGIANSAVGLAELAAADLNQIKVTMSKDGEKQGEGKATDAMGDQWGALLWLVNQILSQGYTLKAGAYLMTGSLGKIYPASSGDYIADYGDFGQVVFSIK